MDNHTDMKKFTIKLLTLALVLFVLSCKRDSAPEPKYNNYDSAILTTKLIDLDTGWGYSIYKNDKLFIYQDLIPSISGRFTFSTAEQAQITADYIVKIMSTKSGLPSVTFEELDSLGVLDDDIVEFQKKIRSEQ